jgi:polyphosphate kinase
MRIRREAQLFTEGKPARIALKLNSLVDEQIIDELYLAAKSGVPIDILVRGMCALRPGVPGLSESIRVHSVLGRYLEHSRIFYFENDGDPDVFIGSADMMHRNLDRRVETLVKLVQTDHIRDLKDIMDLGMSERVATWVLGPDGQWSRRSEDEEGNRLPDMQDELMQLTLNKKRIR